MTRGLASAPGSGHAALTHVPQGGPGSALGSSGHLGRAALAWLREGSGVPAEVPGWGCRGRGGGTREDEAQEGKLAAGCPAFTPPQRLSLKRTEVRRGPSGSPGASLPRRGLRLPVHTAAGLALRLHRRGEWGLRAGGPPCSSWPHAGAAGAQGRGAASARPPSWRKQATATARKVGQRLGAQQRGGAPGGSPWAAGLRGLWWRSPGEEEARGASRSGLDLEPGVGGGKGRARSRALSCRHRTTCSFASGRESVCQAEWGRVWAQKHPSGEDIVASIFQAGGMGSMSLAGSWQSWSCPCTSLCLSFQNMGLSKGTPS